MRRSLSWIAIAITVAACVSKSDGSPDVSISYYDLEPDDELVFLGVHAGTEFSQAKRLMNERGYHAKPALPSEAVEDFPEIACGAGRDAVCCVAVDDTNGTPTNGLLVDQQDGKWVVRSTCG